MRVTPRPQHILSHAGRLPVVGIVPTGQLDDGTAGLLASEECSDDPEFAAVLRSQLELMEREAAQVTEWLHLTTGLVPPGPR